MQADTPPPPSPAPAPTWQVQELLNTAARRGYVPLIGDLEDTDAGIPSYLVTFLPSGADTPPDKAAWTLTVSTSPRAVIPLLLIGPADSDGDCPTWWRGDEIEAAVRAMPPKRGIPATAYDQDGAWAPLTIGWREITHKRPFATRDTETGAWFCDVCLEDLPRAWPGQSAHWCADAAPLNATEAAEAALVHADQEAAR